MKDLMKPVAVTVSGLDSEELYFKKQEQDQIKKLREEAKKEADQKYREAHRYHCFRCGTPSLVEVHRGDVRIEVCVNEKCGAVHLDPGELEALAKDSGTLGRVHAAIMNIFK